MASKSNIRSMRFSDTMIEMIESQVGDTFTAKFEALVTRCMWELPAKEKELERIKQEIKEERSRLNKIQQYRRDLEQSYSRMNLDAHRCLNMLGQGIGLLKRLLEKEEES